MMTLKDYEGLVFRHFAYRLFEKRDIIRQDPRMLYARCEGGSGYWMGAYSNDRLGFYLDWWEQNAKGTTEPKNVIVRSSGTPGIGRWVSYADPLGNITQVEKNIYWPIEIYSKYIALANDMEEEPYHISEIVAKLFGKEALHEFNEQYIKSKLVAEFNSNLNDSMKKYRAGNITKKDMLEQLARCGYVIISALPWGEEQSDDVKCHFAQIRLEKHLQKCNYVYGSVMVEVGDETPYKTVVVPNTYVVFAARYDKDLLDYKTTDVWELCEWAKSIAPSCYQPLIGFHIPCYIEGEIRSNRTFSYICTQDKYQEQTDSKSTRREVIMRKGKIVERVDVNSLDTALNNYFHHLLHNEKVIGRSHVQFVQSPKVPFNKRLF